MLDLRAPALDPARGERLPREPYRQDFRRRDAAVTGRDSWKLERRQHFKEQDDPSREAMSRGDWDEALRLLEAERADVLAAVRDDHRRGTAFHRLRVVEEPLTPYVQWELHALRVQAECGMRVRVVPAGAVRPVECAGQLPELVCLGGQTLYQVLYTDDGAPDGALRFTEPDIVEPWESFLTELYQDGEDVISYVDRVVMRLPPPDAGSRPAGVAGEGG